MPIHSPAPELGLLTGPPEHEEGTDTQLGWYCLMAQPKHEHIAASHVATQERAEAFAPRIRFRRSTRKGPVWVTEALFPGYFFARIAKNSLRRVHCAREVRGVVHFGSHWPTIPASTIEQLKNSVGEIGIRVIAPEIHPGDSVKIINGSFSGFEAIVTRVMSGRERAAVLLNFLGRQTAAEIDSRALVKNIDQRKLVL